MTDLTLVRTYGDSATTGICSVGGRALFTIERAKSDPIYPCVPEGTYQLMPYMSPSHGATWVLVNHALGVGFPPEHRTYCELHSANWARQLEGCVAFGFEGTPMLDPTTGKVSPAVEESRDAIAFLLSTLGPMTTGHTLTITSA